MPRQARLDMPGALHHIMVRGINKKAVFNDKEDKEQLLQRLGINLVNGQGFVYAWVVMDNHLHLLIKSGKLGISDIMRKLLTWYAQYYNRLHRRRGHLFENRYKSILCDEDAYLLALIRYIHLNPVRAGIVGTMKELDEYPWCGHSAIIGKISRSWMDIDYVLAQFGTKKRVAGNAYRKFIEEGITTERKPELIGGGLVRSSGGWSEVIAKRRRGQKEDFDERILGGGNFVQEVLKEAEDRQIRQLKIQRRGITIGTIIEEECTKAGISEKEVRAGSRRGPVSRLRARIAYRGREELGLSAAEIASHMGVATSSITRAIDRVFHLGG
jgi:putative transposase